MSRTLLVGDVHGCREELDRLLERVAWTPKDQVVFVGDLIARGPDSKGVLAVARRIGAVVVRGNHEEKLLAWRAERQGRGQAIRKLQGGGLSRMHIEIAESLEEEDWALLELSPLWYPLPKHKAVVMHAGLFPGVPLDQQEPRVLLRIRAIAQDGTPTDEKGTQDFWGKAYEGPPHVVFGHNAMPEPQLHPWATGIDTACVYGGCLTALVLPEGEPVPRGVKVKEWLVSEPAQRVYSNWKKKTFSTSHVR